ncbi:hypothetical protein C8F04DRAFT_1255487 [Mycena alexandri]|uniref:Uncharacterized protein n=1 Tax=Mycena alexandri TaxID=1745969 RepID=A0AAD6T485_9AGAR|nr:hypothetical protein C8F04DRAFT_1255487 [Mycena alexandri]
MNPILPCIVCNSSLAPIAAHHAHHRAAYEPSSSLEPGARIFLTIIQCLPLLMNSLISAGRASVVSFPPSLLKPDASSTFTKAFTSSAHETPNSAFLVANDENAFLTLGASYHLRYPETARRSQEERIFPSDLPDRKKITISS